MNEIEILGLVAGALTTSSSLPQLRRTFRRRSASDLSLQTSGMVITGVVLWLVYGAMQQDLALMASNVAALSLHSALLFAILRYR